MPRGPQLTDAEKAEILAHHSHGMSQRHIAEEVKRSRSCIQKFLSRPHPSQQRQFKPRNQKLTAKATRLIIRQAARTMCSASDLQRQYDLPVSVRRVQQVLNSVLYLKYQKMPKGPYLNKSHKVFRLEWAKSKLDFGAIKWKRVVFSDEKKFNLEGLDGLACYWHDLRTTPEIFSKRQQGGKSLMIWAAISYHGLSELDRIHGTQNSEKYCETLERSLLPFAAETLGEHWTLQHDNASIHQSNYTKSWLQEKEVDVLDWPAKSPDLKINENVWGHMAREVYREGRQYESLESLAEAVVAAWS